MFVLPDLPYDYKALEPFIDEETMHLHHDKHHAAYVKNLNDALSGHEDLLNTDIETLLKSLDKVPEEIRTKVRNNGGGVANHNMFWEVMAPPKNQSPEGKISEAINNSFGDLDEFKMLFTEKALARFGSGWIWLIAEKDGGLTIEDTPNQDSPVMEGDKTPILCLDVWEHAYYLKYKNVRADYVNAWWNVVNWIKVGEYYKKVGDKK
jgi:Fe-Mn family superoxide dismutase